VNTRVVLAAVVIGARVAVVAVCGGGAALERRGTATSAAVAAASSTVCSGRQVGELALATDAAIRLARRRQSSAVLGGGAAFVGRGNASSAAVAAASSTGLPQRAGHRTRSQVQACCGINLPSGRRLARINGDVDFDICETRPLARREGPAAFPQIAGTTGRRVLDRNWTVDLEPLVGTDFCSLVQSVRIPNPDQNTEPSRGAAVAGKGQRCDRFGRRKIPTNPHRFKEVWPKVPVTWVAISGDVSRVVDGGNQGAVSICILAAVRRAVGQLAGAGAEVPGVPGGLLL
jgi:hypothetical protein